MRGADGEAHRGPFERGAKRVYSRCHLYQGGYYHPQHYKGEAYAGKEEYGPAIRSTTSPGHKCKLSTPPQNSEESPSVRRSSFCSHTVGGSLGILFQNSLAILSYILLTSPHGPELGNVAKYADNVPPVRIATRRRCEDIRGVTGPVTSPPHQSADARFRQQSATAHSPRMESLDN